MLRLGDKIKFNKKKTVGMEMSFCTLSRQSRRVLRRFTRPSFTFIFYICNCRCKHRHVAHKRFFQGCFCEIFLSTVFHRDPCTRDTVAVYTVLLKNDASRWHMRTRVRSVWPDTVLRFNGSCFWFFHRTHNIT